MQKLMSKEEPLSALMAFSGGEGISFAPDFKTAIKTPNIHKASPGFVGRMLVSGYASKGQVTLSGS